MLSRGLHLSALEMSCLMQASRVEINGVTTVLQTCFTHTTASELLKIARTQLLPTGTLQPHRTDGQAIDERLHTYFIASTKQNAGVIAIAWANTNRIQKIPIRQALSLRGFCWHQLSIARATGDEPNSVRVRCTAPARCEILAVLSCSKKYDMVNK